MLTDYLSAEEISYLNNVLYVKMFCFMPIIYDIDAHGCVQVHVCMSCDKMKLRMKSYLSND